MSERKKLGEILVSRGSVGSAQVQLALDAQRGAVRARLIGQLLVEQGAVDDDTVAKALSQQLGLPYVDPLAITVDSAAVWKLPRRVAEHAKAIPYARLQRGWKVAMADPRNSMLIRDLEFALGGPVKPEVAAESRVIQAIHRHYDLEPLAHRMLEDVPVEMRAPVVSPTTLELDAPAIERNLQKGGTAYVELFNFLLVNAIERGASDIHLEAELDGMRIRFRIDGMLREVLHLPPWAMQPITTRIKVVGRMKVIEHRKPQDGRATAELGKRKVDLRLSTVPSQFGESIVVRILDSKTLKVDLGALGWNAKGLASYFHLVSQNQGLILVVGPTGSGKTTTLYSTINRLSGETTSIVTVEDPIEHSIPGVRQVQVDDANGMGFAQIARSVLRQDPNVLVIGEMRDPDSAMAALDAATTGHLVLSTMHTSHSVAALTRLRDLGVPNYLAGHAILGVVSQRLLRKVCPVCSIPGEPSFEDWERLDLEPEPMGPKARTVGAGCPTCQYAGYSGRLGAFEVLKIDDSLRGMILRGGTEADLWREARSHGFTSMLDDAFEKVRQGETTLEEVARTVPVEPWRERRKRIQVTQRSADSGKAVSPTPRIAPPMIAPAAASSLMPGAVAGEGTGFSPRPSHSGSAASSVTEAPRADAASPLGAIGGGVATSSAVPHSPAAPARPVRTRPLILAVDDAEEILALIGATLEDDYDMIYAHDGIEALEMVATFAPDALALDVMMPRMSGYEVCKRLKDDPATAEIPVLILSARGDSSHIKDGFHAGADDYLPKPFDPEEMELRLRALLRRAGRLAR